MSSRFFLACFFVAGLALTAPGRVAASPPQVIKAAPDNGDTDVDPKLKEIRIEFDQDMRSGGHSICGAGPAMPEVRGKPRWVGRRIFVLPVRLKPDHEYSFSINCPAAQNFRSAAGEAAVPYPIAFKTGDGKSGGNRKLTPEENRKAITELRRAIDENYAYRDLRRVDWGKQFEAYGPKLETADSAPAFARLAAKLLAPAEDVHVWLAVGETQIGTHVRRITPNVDLKALTRAISAFEQHNDVVATGHFKDGIGYILIANWSPTSPAQLEPAFQALADLIEKKVPAVVIDVRPNAGGNEALALEFAGCFVDRPAIYSRHVFRDPTAPDGWSRTIDRTVRPKKGRPRFDGRVAVLMGPANMSTCESFILMMKQSPRCTLVGDRTYGSSGNPRPFDLGNGVSVFLPSWKDMLPDGTLLEGKGIGPDTTVVTTPEDFAKGDRVIATALKLLRN